MKHYSPTGRKNHGRPLKRLLDKWDRNISTSGPTPWQIYDDDDDDDVDVDDDDDDDDENVRLIYINVIRKYLVTFRYLMLVLPELRCE
jgi:hypothetical protein